MANPTLTQFKGLDNRNNPESLIRLAKHEARMTEAQNVDVSASLAVSRRAGFSRQDSGAYHSLWSNAAGTVTLAVKNQRLIRINPDLSIDDLGGMSERPVSYADTGAGVYLSDGQGLWVYSAGAVQELARAGTYAWPTRTALSPEEEEVFYSAPPPGTLLAWMFGRLWTATKHGVFYSRAYRPDSFDLRNDYLDMPEVVLLAAVDDGFYIGTDIEVYFCAGGNPKEPSAVRKVCNYGAVARASLETNAEFFGFKELAGRVVVFETERGKVLGANSGQIIELTSRHVATSAAISGSMFMREQNGQNHLVSALADKSGEGSNMRATDIATAEIRRNGVLI